jgi:hypothetical protein
VVTSTGFAAGMVISAQLWDQGNPPKQQQETLMTKTFDDNVPHLLRKVSQVLEQTEMKSASTLLYVETENEPFKASSMLQTVEAKQKLDSTLPLETDEEKLSEQCDQQSINPEQNIDSSNANLATNLPTTMSSDTTSLQISTISSESDGKSLRFSGVVALNEVEKHEQLQEQLELEEQQQLEHKQLQNYHDSSTTLKAISPVLSNSRSRMASESDTG